MARLDTRDQLALWGARVILDLLDPQAPLVLRDPPEVPGPLVQQELLAVLALLGPQERKVLRDRMEQLALQAPLA